MKDLKYVKIPLGGNRILRKGGKSMKLTITELAMKELEQYKGKKVRIYQAGMG
jgi:hypothetical protein